MKYVCRICGYVYDEEKQGMLFSELPENWACPLCGAKKALFAPEQKEKPGEEAAAADPGYAGEPSDDAHEDMEPLSHGVLAAVCSNLARGCEKQYKEEEAGLFGQLAEYFSAAAAKEEASLSLFDEMLMKDLSAGYPALRSAAAAAGDRGTMRICVWGEKVTMILHSLIGRYRQEGDEFLKNTKIWVCTVCGFVYVGDEPPKLCPVCKVPDWKFEQIEGRESA